MNEIVSIVTANPVLVLTDAAKYTEFYAHVKAECDQFVPDISTVTSRARIAAQAHKVVRTKTAIDAAGKKLNEEARSQINVVDASRRKIREELDALADAVRKPLTDWEDAEKARAAEVANIIGRLDNYVNIQTRGWGSDHVREHIADLDAISLDADVLRDKMDEAVARKLAATKTLSTALDAAVQYEADQAELGRLRAEAEAREKVERERIEAERIAKAKAEEAERQRREYDEEVRMRAEAEEKTRKESAEREARAVEAARQDAVRKANEAHRAELAKVEAENRRLAQIEAERLAEIERNKREEDARAADRAHRSAVMKQAKDAIMTLGVDEEPAKKVVLAIVANEIPNVTLRF
jgi:colicin import membrane protein